MIGALREMILEYIKKYIHNNTREGKRESNNENNYEIRAIKFCLEKVLKLIKVNMKRINLLWDCISGLLTNMGLEKNHSIRIIGV